MALRRSGSILKLCLAGGLVGTSVAVLHRNDWDLSSTGAVRFGRAAVAAAAVAVDYKKSLHGLDDSTPEYKELKSQVHLRSALRLREMCCANGGCYIKVGQHLGALEYLLPKEYTDTMKVLHSDAPRSPLKDLYKVIKEDLGKDVDELFSSFDPEPLGAASLAQVHKAITKEDGRVVAVKVQHAKVKAHSFVDMKTMELLVHCIAWLFPDFQFLWMAEESKRNLPLELDFLQEGRNCERVGHMLKHFSFLKVPKIHWELSTERVLTMEYCEGGQVNDGKYMKKHNIPVDEVSRKLGKLYSEMIFVEGYIHCDPHPGNVLVNQSKEGTEIVLLDHGLYQTLTDDFRLDYCNLWMCLINADLPGIQHYAGKLGTGELAGLFACMVTARSWEAITAGIDKRKFTDDEDDEIKRSVGMYLPQIAQILNKVPRQMLLLFKTNDLLRGIEHNLKTRANARSFVTMSKCCVRAVYEDKHKNCNSQIGKLKLGLQKQIALLKISIYELYLWISSSPVARLFSWGFMKKSEVL